MKIALGWDHRGAEAADALRRHLEEHGHEALMLGPDGDGPVDYPEPAGRVGRAVADGDARFGVLMCGSGIGMSIAANKIAGVRAALACDATAAEMGRRHNDANVLCLATDRHTTGEAVAMVESFLAAEFEAGRHQRRVDKINALDGATARRSDEATEGCATSG